MIKKIFAASLISLALATSVMAQASGGNNSGDNESSAGPTGGATGKDGTIGAPPEDACPADGMKKDASGNSVKCSD